MSSETKYESSMVLIFRAQTRAIMTAIIAAIAMPNNTNLHLLLLAGFLSFEATRLVAGFLVVDFEVVILVFVDFLAFSAIIITPLWIYYIMVVLKMLQVGNLDADLSGGVAVANGNSVIFERIEINNDALGGADFVLLAIALTDVAGIIPSNIAVFGAK